MPTPKQPASAGPVLLDTHVWVWTMEGANKELSRATVSLIEDAAEHSLLAVSAISIWEMAMLEAKARITLSRTIDEWIAAALTAKGVHLAQLTPEIAVESSRLPGEVHGDPSDRMIIATARVLGATLITCDDQILRYGALGHLRVRNGRARA